MRINSKRLKQSLKYHKRCNTQWLNGNSNAIRVINNDVSSKYTKEFTKFNYNEVKVNLWSNIFPLSLNTCFSYSITKFSIFKALYQVLLFQMTLANGAAGSSDASSNQGQREKLESRESEKSFFDDPLDWMMNHFNCVMGGNQSCMQLTFLIIFLVGAVLSALGVMYKYLCKCCTCCCSKKKEQVDYREQFEQLQQEQEELRKALMDGQYFDKNKLDPGEKKSKDDRDDRDDKDERDDKDDKSDKYDKNGKNDKYSDKNNDSSNGTNEPRMRRSQSDSFHIGYQKPQQ
ncbi:hypothetical protein POCGH01_00153200 [Plasmodium ovale]|uniref:Uncharacterized protein n=1 Tax=Plasmodium ovale TaxID=36330 RepID=A0A1D3JDK2_PLAOA|nr:hypothetical protein POCGH01_00153200 [Plasmodium ovale]